MSSHILEGTCMIFLVLLLFESWKAEMTATNSELDRQAQQLRDTLSSKGGETWVSETIECQSSPCCVS